MMGPSMDWGALVGIPFREKGRDRAGCDCWGCVRLAFLEGKGIELPSYEEGYASIADRAEIRRLFDGAKTAWLRVPHGEERPFDVLLMTILRTDHVGIVVRPGLMLHMPPRTASVIEPYTGSRYGAATARGAFYRYETA